MKNTITFKQFLGLDQPIVEQMLIEVEKKKKIPKPKPRPKKVLWFYDKNNWNSDLQFAHGGKFNYHTSQEEEEDARSVYATDSSNQVCYGVWQGGQKRGVTFHKPRPLHAVKHPRMVIKPTIVHGTQATNIKR